MSSLPTYTSSNARPLWCRHCANAPPPAEQAGRLPQQTFDALSQADVFRMTAPRRFGGHEVDFQTQCDVLAEFARGCPSASWVATIFSAMSWLAGVFPDEAQEEVFATRDPRISGVFSPTGTAIRKDGGFIVSGRWGYNTGGHGSEWTVVNAVLAGDEPRAYRCASSFAAATSPGSTTGTPAAWPQRAAARSLPRHLRPVVPGAASPGA